jgi:HlyD family secretion protein
MALTRLRADLRARIASNEATISRAGQRIEEVSLSMLAAKTEFQDHIAQELVRVNSELAQLEEALTSTGDVMTRTEIRAPVSGTVVGLTVFTKGGVIEPGQKLMDIVPDRAPLTVEAKISSADGDDVRVGQDAFVRFETLHDRSIPEMTGKVVRVSADVFTDERTGASYYTAEISVPVSELEEIEQLRAQPVLRAGIPVTITIPLRKRTALEYAFEPITSALRGSFHEQ